MTDVATERALEIGVRLAAGPELTESARTAERLGFDFAFVGEHVLSTGDSTNAFVALAAAAAVTERIKLLSAVTLLPLYPAALAAKMAAVLDDLSGGRFHLGVGVGGEHRTEFDACGVPLHERGRRVDEALHIVRGLLNGESVTYRGRWAEFEDAALRPSPRRPSGPPIWVAGRGEPSIRRAGRLGDGWMPYLMQPERIHSGIAAVKEEAQASGRNANGMRFAAYVLVAVGANGAEAKRLGQAAVGAKFGRPEDSRLTRHVVAGTVGDCVDQLLGYREAGVDALMFNLACLPEEAEAMTRRLGEELAPSLRRAATRR